MRKKVDPKLCELVPRARPEGIGKQDSRNLGPTLSRISIRASLSHNSLRGVEMVRVNMIAPRDGVRERALHRLEILCQSINTLTSTWGVDNVFVGYCKITITNVKGFPMLCRCMYRHRLKRWDVVARSLFLFLLICSALPCMGPA